MPKIKKNNRSESQLIETNILELDKVTKFYIEKNCNELSLDQICADTQLDKNSIESYYHACLDNEKKNDTIDKLMSVNTKKGYAVMTKEASEKGEQNKQNPNRRNKTEHIHKIRADK